MCIVLNSLRSQLLTNRVTVILDILCMFIEHEINSKSCCFITIEDSNHIRSNHIRSNLQIQEKGVKPYNFTGSKRQTLIIYFCWRSWNGSILFGTPWDKIWAKDRILTSHKSYAIRIECPTLYTIFWNPDRSAWSNQ